MKTYRKTSLFLVIVLSLTLLSSCGKKEGSTTDILDPKNPTTVTLWHYYISENQQALEAAVAEFNCTLGIQYGVIIDPIAQGRIADLEDAVTASALGTINSQPMPDIFSSYPDKALEIDGYDMVCDLSEYFTEEEMAEYVPGFLASGVFDGRMLVVPIVKSVEIAYLNESSWDEFAAACGVTLDGLSTWESVYDVARQYYNWTDAKTPDTLGDGRGLLGIDSTANFIIAACKQMGIDVIDGANAQAVLDNDVLRRIFDVYYNGMVLGYFDGMGAQCSDLIKSGELIAYAGSSSSVVYFPTWIEQNGTRQPIKFRALEYPTFEGGRATTIQQGAGMCVAKSTPEKQAGAALFLKWFTDYSVNIDFSMTTGYLPVETSSYASEEFTKALDSLSEGDDTLKNVADVYKIALEQITGDYDTYAAIPFAGSYDVRSTLQSTLMNIVSEDIPKTDQMWQEGKTEAQILAELDTDARFEMWLSDIHFNLEMNNIPYTSAK